MNAKQTCETFEACGFSFAHETQRDGSWLYRCTTDPEVVVYLSPNGSSAKFWTCGGGDYTAMAATKEEAVRLRQDKVSRGQRDWWLTFRQSGEEVG
jgi:hypothetical protein